jgi:hypothetical protein
MAVEIVLDSHVEEHPDVTVGYPIEDLPTLLAGSDQTGQTQLAELMTRCRLAHLDETGEIAHAQFARFQQGIDHPEAAGICQQLEALRQQHGVIGFQHRIGYRAVTMFGRRFSHPFQSKGHNI